MQLCSRHNPRQSDAVLITVSKFDYVKRNLEVKNDEDSLSGINVEASGIGRVLKSIAEKEKKENQVRTSSDYAPSLVLYAFLTTVVRQAKENPNRIPPPSAAVSEVAPTPAATSSTLISQSTGPVPYNTATVSTNRTAASFTSTSTALSTAVENALWDEEDLMYEAVREKGERGYARMRTNYGDLNLELYAERAPRTCYNFLKVRVSHDRPISRIVILMLSLGSGENGIVTVGTRREISKNQVPSIDPRLHAARWRSDRHRSWR